MTEIKFVSEPTVKVTRIEGCDLDVARAAWVSTKGQRAEDEVNEARVAGLINMLVRDRHGSPLEQVGLQLLTSTTIFTWREHMRHRIASYNEQSGRYMQLEPKFYLPSPERPLVQEGKPGAYTFVPGSPEQVRFVQEKIAKASISAYQDYEDMLEFGIAKEVARMVLPVNIFSTAYVRMNLRALMNFLSLRTKDEDALVPSFPQYEIEQVADLYEASFKEHFPITHAAFVKNGRVSP